MEIKHHLFHLLKWSYPWLPGYLFDPLYNRLHPERLLINGCGLVWLDRKDNWQLALREWHPGLVGHFRNCLKPNYTVLVYGCGAGHLVLMAHWIVGKYGRIVGWEINPEFHDALWANVLGKISISLQPGNPSLEAQQQNWGGIHVLFLNRGYGEYLEELREGLLPRFILVRLAKGDFKSSGTIENCLRKYRVFTVKEPRGELESIVGKSLRGDEDLYCIRKDVNSNQ